jgi:glycosyltransferase involved in cell wall biosynthesis
MHIVMLSDLETQGGGASVAVTRLAQMLCEMGYRVTRLVTQADHQMHPWQTEVLAPPLAPTHRIVRRLLPLFEKDRWDSYFAPIVQRQLKNVLHNLQPDIINIHNLHSAVANGWSPTLMSICADYASTVWTLHDMWSFTGRCAYSYDCRKFITGCDVACPTPAEPPTLAPKRISAAWQQRQRLLSDHCQIAAVTPSRWLAREAELGLWRGHRIEVIPYGLPLDIYQPSDKAIARQRLDIKTPGPILLMVAVDLTDWRKGGDILRSALSSIFRPVTVLLLGDRQINIEAEDIHLHPLGDVWDETTKVLAYNAADILVHPARIDNLPNVVMEAIACGTPVIGFPIGGVPDMVHPGQTGWLAPEVSLEALAHTINIALNEIDEGVNLRQSCRELAEAEYDLKTQAWRYLSLFQSLCN